VLSKRQRRPDILAQWARLPIPVDSSAAPAVRRERLVNAVARSMLDTKARPAMRRRVYAWLAAAAVAMVALAVVGGTIWRGRTTSEPVAAHLFALSGSSRALVGGREIVSSSATSGGVPLVFNSQVATGRASSSRMQLRSGVEVTVGPETQLSLPDARDPVNVREELVLELGLIRVKVPKLPRGHFFAVRTPDTVVSVHGTAFSVEVTKSSLSAPPKTTVIVTEGVVSVQHSNREILLDAGAEWTSSVESVDRGAPESSGEPVLKPGPATTRAPAKRSEHAPASATSSVLDAGMLHERTASQAALANQNRLFSEAMSARDHGDSSGAIGLLEDFIQRYPGAPLAQDAYVERFRVLAEMGKHAAAARAARSYLALYPNGFAGVEARQLALESPAGP
jgi:ferric-dicitrate binding protein FerR (iron transport regulator)